MNKSLKFFLIFNLFCFVFICCTKSKLPESTEWQGTISEKNGIKEINNPPESLYGELVLDIEQDLSIGNEKDENLIFYQAGPIIVNDNGEIFLMDGGNNRIQKFDQSGVYLQTIGKKGQGPGEFESMYSIFIDQQNNLYISESMRIQKFDSQGKFEKIFSLSNRITNFYVAQDGTIYGNALKTSEGGRDYYLVKIDSEGKEIATVADFAGIKTAERESDGRRMRFAVNHGYNYLLYLGAAEKLMYSYSANYIIYRLGIQGTPDLIIKKDAPFLPISNQEKNRMIEDIRERISQMGQTWPEGVLEEACVFPEHRPFLSGMVQDDLGRTYAYRTRSSLDDADKRKYDIFGPEGYFLYTATLDFLPNVIKNGHIYRIKEDEDTGDVRILRFLVKNWDSIKTGI